MLTCDMPDRNHATTGRFSDDGAEQEDTREQDKRNISKDFIKEGRLEVLESEIGL